MSSVLFLAISLCYGGEKKCGATWVGFGETCYYFYNITDTTQGQSREDASFVCKNFGGQLLSIKSKNVSDFVSQIFKNKQIKLTQNYWIGLNDLKVEGKYLWEDGTPLNVSAFLNWRSSEKEPNNYKNEDCVEISWDGKWNDNKCYHRLGFICERKIGAKPLPTPKLPPVTQLPTAPRTCEAGWIPWGTSCYGLIMGIPKTWEDARADCLRRFGDLVVIETRKELNFLTNELQKYNSEYWIGLHDQHSEKNFQWVNKKKLGSVTNWRKGEPSNDYGVEDCVEMYGKWAPGQWNDNYCNSIHDYVCEKQSGVHNCPQDWITHDDYCYQINAHPNQKTTWEAAHKACQDFNKPWEAKIKVAEANLVSIAGKAEQKMLYKEFMKMGLPGSGNYYWIGLHHNRTTPWSWTDRSPYKYQNWQGPDGMRHYNCVKSALVNENSGWLKASCYEKHNYVCKVKRGQDRCFDPMGMQNFGIPDSSITTNNQFSSGTPAHAARLYLKAGNSLDGAWCASNKTKRPWLQIDFGEPQKLTYMAIQGKSNSDAMVTAFYFMYSLDGISWDTYGDYPPARFYKFRSSVNHRTTKERVMNLPLPAHLVARYVRVYPIEWNKHCCMRVEFYGCPHAEENQKCGLGWREDKSTGHCYKFNPQRTSLDAASGLCLAQGSQLLSITTWSEKTFIDTQLRGLSGRFSDYWIGLTDLDSEGMFQWIDRSPVTLTNWYRNSPRFKDVSANCVAIRAADGFWVNVDCTTYRTFICKRKYKRAQEKKALSNNWRTEADYYWPLEDVDKKTAIGTIPAKAFGKEFPHSDFRPDMKAPDMKAHRHFIAFDGKTNYLEIPGLGRTCASNPDSANCPHGITVSFLFRYREIMSSRPRYILDTLGQRGRSSVGYSVFIKFSKIYVVLRGHEIYYSAFAAFRRNVWTHFVFKWSTLDGLKIYINGLLKFRRLFGSRNIAYLTKESVTSLFIGKSATFSRYTKVQVLSLAIFEKLLAPTEVQRLYRAEFGVCRWGQIGHGTFCYEFNVTELNYYDASRSCEAKGGNLISIHSPIEEAFLSVNAGKYGLNSDTWIGLNANKENNIYNWTDGTEMKYSHWGPLAPSNYRGRGEYCVHTFQGGFWNDNLCFLGKSFACKYERALNYDEKSDKARNYTVTLYFYQTRTFGCTLSKKVHIKTVLYGSVKDKCLLKQEEAKEKVQKDCKGARCRNVRANDHYFGNKDPCEGKRTTTKKLIITYTCVDDDLQYNIGCPHGYSINSGNGICYKLYQEKLNITEASKVCQHDKGSLTSIANYYEELFLTSMMSQMFEVTDVWIGLKYEPEGQRFTWLNGKRVTYTNWLNKLPDPRVGKNVKVSIHKGSDRFVFWSTANSTEKHPFFCRALKSKATERPPTRTIAPAGKCLKGWSHFKNYCYFANNQSLTHVIASIACSRLAKGAQLTSITSAEENQFLFKLTEKQEKRWFSTWLGLTNEAIIKGYHWMDYEPLSYINWNTNTPYTGLRHLCVGMNSGGKWWDLPCHSRYPSFCKMKIGSDIKTPTPTQAVVPTGKQGPSVCKKGWLFFNGSCYYFSSEAADYHVANVACRNMSSHLASVHSKEENDFIHKEMLRRHKTHPIYIGLHDMSVEAGWEWTDGSVVQFVTWDKNQPDNWHGQEDCVNIRPNGKWNDAICNSKHYYVCEVHNETVIKKPEPVPDSGYCDNGWILYGNKCYLFKVGSKERRNHDDAKSYCRQWKGGDLVSIHSNYENAFLLSHLQDSAYSVYIGLSDYMREGKYWWTDQSSVQYTNWYLRQPSRYRSEDCVEMFPFYLYRGRWNDIHCGKELGFICMKASSPKPPLPTLPPTGSSEKPCPSGYKRYMKDCYKVIDKSLTWGEARKECQKEEKGDLVSFHDPFRQAFVFSQFVKHANETWIGLYKEATDSELRWPDDSPVDYRHWKNGQLFVPKKDSTVCVSQVFSQKLDGRWVTRNCTDKLPFTCKVMRGKAVGVSEYEGNCSQGWMKHNKMCYKYFKTYSDRTSWAEAREKCKRYGGDLATVDTKEIQSVIFYLVRSSFTSVWIGLNDREQEHIWRWSSGKPYSIAGYSNWADVEPNDNSGSENCVELRTSSGKWNDLHCTLQHPFVCEHPLECRDPLGMESHAIRDEAITATNYTTIHLPKYARLKSVRDGKETSWCTAITDGKQNLTINLGALMHVTVIQTQGMFPYHVISYKLFYSDDGIDWKAYTEMKGPNPEPRIMPGNEKGSKVEGVSVDLHAVYLRFMPILFKLNLDKNLVCMRVELFGCKSVCRQSLGIGDHRMIPDENLKASSNGKNVSSIRLSPSKKEWCAEAGDKHPWVLIDFQHHMEVTRILLVGRGTESYTLQYSMDGKKFTDYGYGNGTAKVFSINVKLHDLETHIVARYIKILPYGDQRVCMNVELYGCPYDCSVALGMESNNIPNALITSSTNSGNHFAHKGRLNAPDGNYWRAQFNDKSQYLQIDFTRTARFTGLATQGCGETMYVKTYYLQWSSDGNFWHHSTEELIGNLDSTTIQKIRLKQSILARYLRINPSSWNSSICMRVEVYGCAIGKLTIPSKAHKSVFLGKLRLTEEKYNDKLADPTSNEFKTLEKKVQVAVAEVYSNDENFNNGVVEVIVNGFLAGSVVADFTVIITEVENRTADPVQVLKREIKKGTVGKLKVDKNSLTYKKEIAVVVSAVKRKKDQSGLSEGGKIGLLVFFFLLIAGVLITGAVFYMKRSKRGFKLQFAHKTFENPIHIDFSTDEHGDTVNMIDSQD